MNTHRKLYVAWKTGPPPAPGSSSNNMSVGEGEDEEETLQEPTLMESSDKEDFVVQVQVQVEQEKDGGNVEMLESQANDIIDKWLEKNQISNAYLYDKANLLPQSKDATMKLEQVIASFDTMKYYREKGSIDFPSVTMLARIHFGRLDNGGFQERMFSTASLAMAKEQNRMDFDLLEMRTLLAQNKELIEKKII